MGNPTGVLSYCFITILCLWSLDVYAQKGVQIDLPVNRCPPGLFFNPKTKKCEGGPQKWECPEIFCKKPPCINKCKCDLLNCPPGTFCTDGNSCIPDKCPNGAKFDPASGKCVCPEILCVRSPCINPCKCALLNCPKGTSCTEDNKCKPKECPEIVCVRSPCINQCKCDLLNCPPGTTCTEDNKCKPKCPRNFYYDAGQNKCCIPTPCARPIPGSPPCEPYCIAAE